MDFFLTAETTIDFIHAEFNIILEFEEKLRSIHNTVIVDGISRIGIVYIIMNPALCPPFPHGLIFRKSRAELDVKPQIDFHAWMAKATEGKRALLVESAIEMVSLSKNLGESRKSTIIGLLQVGCTAL